MKPNLILNTKGLFCPMPIIKTSDAMRSLDAGSIIEVISDDPAIKFDMPAWCKSHGHTIEALTRQGDDYHYFVRKVIHK